MATVLIAGTITALSFPSFMITGAAQAQSYYDDDRMYNDYNSYGPTDYYRDDKDKKYDDSYGPTDYRMDNNNRKSYGNDNGYESQYQPSLKPDYKPKYPSYGTDDRRDKSKDSSSKSVSLNNLNCINTNININGNNTGDINLGNKGADKGYSSAYSSNGGGKGYGNDGYDNKRDKGFDCIINNNNTNINLVVAGGGNVTDGNGNETDPCEECFAQVLNATELDRLEVALENGINVTITIGTPQIEINSLEELCNVLENVTGGQIRSVVMQILREANITLTEAEFDELVSCIRNAGFIPIPRPVETSNINTGGLAAFNTNTAGGVASSFSSPPTIAQGTEDDLSALEKITKLKQQWMELTQ